MKNRYSSVLFALLNIVVIVKLLLTFEQSLLASPERFSFAV